MGQIFTFPWIFSTFETPW